MKHEKKEWHTCDRCGAGIKEIPYAAGQRHILRRSIFNPTELKTLTADRNGYISDTQLIAPEIVSAETVEGYCEKTENNSFVRKMPERF